MKNVFYNLVKIWIKSALHLYYGKIKIIGRANVPKDKPVLFLPNHQNALLDVLLLAVDCERKPYFLTRSDVFKNRILNAVFDFFRMIPIYRIRDGRDALKNNQFIFDKCSELLKRGEAILMFPEANHNLKRRVRPLSKGFTRIVFNTMEKYPDVDIRLVPVGLNYRNAEEFPDKVSIYFGENIPIRNVLIKGDPQTSIPKIKKVVSETLKQLTTHIKDEPNYKTTIQTLNALGVDYLNPKKVNETIAGLGGGHETVEAKKKSEFGLLVMKILFMIFNFPVVLLWRVLVKPKVWEPEFSGTLRFGFAILMYPLYYLILFLALSIIWNFIMAIAVVVAVFVFNWVYVYFS